MSKRADRHDNNYDNAMKHPQGRQRESIPPREANQLILNLRAQKNELMEKAEEIEQQARQNYQLYVEEQDRYQSTLVLYRKEKNQAQSYITRYDQEKVRNGELLIQLATTQSERDQYITLYHDTQSQLKFERRSKAGIKGWETRRKRENERLKNEIGEMTVLLRDSISRRDVAIGNLEDIATRMDRIQNLVDSVEGDSSDNPISLVQKFRRIWQAVQDILAE
ncbi:MAG: hypothetical protein WBA57_20565 [Elainellaceae cyanobacterium]